MQIFYKGIILKEGSAHTEQMAFASGNLPQNFTAKPASMLYKVNQKV